MLLRIDWDIVKHSMHLTPPQSPLQSYHSADDILKLTKEAIEYSGQSWKSFDSDSMSRNVV